MQATDPSGCGITTKLSTTVGILPDDQHGLAAPGMERVVKSAPRYGVWRAVCLCFERPRHDLQQIADRVPGSWPVRMTSKNPAKVNPAGRPFLSGVMFAEVASGLATGPKTRPPDMYCAVLICSFSPKNGCPGLPSSDECGNRCSRCIHQIAAQADQCPILPARLSFTGVISKPRKI